MVAGVSVGTQDQALRTKLHAFRFVRAFRQIRRGAPFYIHRHRASTGVFDQVHPCDQAKVRVRHHHRARPRHYRIIHGLLAAFLLPGSFPFPGTVGVCQSAFLTVHPPVLKPAVHRIHAVRKLRLDPLQPAQPRTIRIFVQHPRRNEVGEFLSLLLRHYRLLLPADRGEEAEAAMAPRVSGARKTAP